MKIDTEELKAAWKVVDQVDQPAGLPSSQFVRLEAKGTALTMSLTGLCVGQATCPVTELTQDWTWHVDRRVLGAFISTAKAKAVQVDVTKDALLWRAGRQKITAAGIDAVAGYAEWDSAKKGHQKLSLTDETKKELALLAKYAPQTAAADHLSAVVLSKGWGALASDSFAIAAVLDKTETRSLKLPALLCQLLAGADASEVLVDAEGAGIKYPCGYLYQPLPSNAISGYPLKKIADVVAAQLPVKALVKVKAKALADALATLKGYVFGSDADAQVAVAPHKSAGFASLTLDVAQGSAQTAVAAESPGDYKLRWQLARLVPWVEHVAALDPEQVVACGEKDGCCSFSARAKTVHRLLVVAETA